ncbi:putative AttH domain-containing protein [Seiridium unicorne]|uniref:AttH domain-containing protein n=1 Tax=Seiridium unicorne TaxID=138068 RepID=A0ABR2ULG2_9PEZI
MNASVMVGGAFDLIYLDVLSESTDPGVNIVSFNTGDFYYQLGNDQPLATFATEGAAIKNDDGGVAAGLKGAGASLVSSNLHKPNVTYTITYDGSAAYPCTFPCDTMDVSGAAQNLLPYLFCANAVPDAGTVVDLTIDGAPLLNTDRIGYHDKDWGQKSVITSPKYWDRGHTHVVGPYAIVWYNLVDYNNTEHTYAYVSKDGEDAFIGCGGATVKVRQWGPANMAYNYPPTNKLGLMANNGLLVDYEFPSGEKLYFNVTTTAIIKTETGNVYSRGVGDVVGGAIGGPAIQVGVA